MSDIASTVAAPAEPITAPVTEVTTPAESPMVYTGSSNNLVPGIALLFGGMLAFAMGMTDVYFAEATAWTFAIWGALLIYSGLLEINETYEVTEDALIIRNVMRPWALQKTFDWGRVTRLDVVVNRTEGKDDDVLMHVYYQPAGELANERRDRVYNPALAAAVIDHAVLAPADKDTPKDITRIPRDKKATFTWK